MSLKMIDNFIQVLDYLEFCLCYLHKNLLRKTWKNENYIKNSSFLIKSINHLVCVILDKETSSHGVLACCFDVRSFISITNFFGQSVTLSRRQSVRDASSEKLLQGHPQNFRNIRWGWVGHFLFRLQVFSLEEICIFRKNSC